MPIRQIQPTHVAAIDWTGLSRRYFNPGELEALVGLVESVNPKVMIEIGVNEGRTAKAFLARDNGLERYIGIDVPQTYTPACAVQAREVPAHPGHMAAHDKRFELILKPRGSLDLLPGDLPAADVIFIDGDHGWRAVLHDSILAQEIVRGGGLIIWHDYHPNPVVDVMGVLDIIAIAQPAIRHIAGTWLCYLAV